ncbi:MAG: hypothetical protein WCE46_03935 [Methanoregula sp.]
MPSGKTYNARSDSPAIVFLGELSASTYARLPPKMQAACRELAERGEITIEGNA